MLATLTRQSTCAPVQKSTRHQALRWLSVAALGAGSSIDRLAEKAREARDLGIPCVALFPNTPGNLRSEDAREALNPDNLICRAIKAIKDAVPEVGVLTDVHQDGDDFIEPVVLLEPRDRAARVEPARVGEHGGPAHVSPSR